VDGPSRATGMRAPSAPLRPGADAASAFAVGLAWELGKAGPWVLASGLLRYAFVAAGRCRPWLRRALAPSFRRKAAAAVQMIALVVVLVPGVPPPAGTLIAAGALARSVLVRRRVSAAPAFRNTIHDQLARKCRGLP
jgi:phosphatidylglycerophosphate synthase